MGLHKQQHKGCCAAAETLKAQRLNTTQISPNPFSCLGCRCHIFRVGGIFSPHETQIELAVLYSMMLPAPFFISLLEYHKKHRPIHSAKYRTPAEVYILFHIMTLQNNQEDHDEQLLDRIPNEYICPITQEIFQDPVMDITGRTYERNAILLWISDNGTCPMTRESRRAYNYIPNPKMAMMVHLWKKQNGLQSENTKDRTGNLIFTIKQDWKRNQTDSASATETESDSNDSSSDDEDTIQNNIERRESEPERRMRLFGRRINHKSRRIHIFRSRRRS